jgi:hypothetical protein
MMKTLHSTLSKNFLMLNINVLRSSKPFFTLVYTFSSSIIQYLCTRRFLSLAAKPVYS